MSARLVATVLGTPDPSALAAFYSELLGWKVTTDKPGWARVVPPEGDGASLSFQLERDHLPPVWPQLPGSQQMQAHLDVQVDDLDRETDRAVTLGATVEGHQPQPDGVRVIRDPHGHLICLFVPGF